MKTRARLISARFAMTDGADNCGTRVVITLPMAAKRIKERQEQT